MRAKGLSTNDLIVKSMQNCSFLYFKCTSNVHLSHKKFDIKTWINFFHWNKSNLEVNNKLCNIKPNISVCLLKRNCHSDPARTECLDGSPSRWLILNNFYFPCMINFKTFIWCSFWFVSRLVSKNLSNQSSTDIN